MGRNTLFIIIALALQTAMAVAATTAPDTLTRGIQADSLGTKRGGSGAADTLLSARLWLGDTPMRLSTDDGVDGSLYNALPLMPGAQVQGETAALVVRGGSSGEQLTFIDGMHVMCPYTSPTGSSLARNSYSTHIVDGFSLIPGGASMEFGNALSAVVAIDTKDRNNTDKFGAMLSTGGINISGNKAFKNASLSADLNYQNLGLSSIFPCRTDYAEPFTMYSSAAQLRLNPSRRTVVKAYAQYDRTTLALNTGAADARIMSLGDDNVYLNATLRHATTWGWSWFAGAAFSYSSQLIKGAAAEGDRYRTRQRELHLKAKTLKALSGKTTMTAGAECYLMGYGARYILTSTDYETSIRPSSGAVFANLRHSIGGRLTADVALRAETTAPCAKTRLMPRIALTYANDNLSVTAQASLYTRRPENSYMLTEPSLLPEECRYASIGAKYSHSGRTAFIEAYVKRYSSLPLNTGTDSWGRTLMSSDGKGRSWGFDLFVSDKATVHGLELQAAYSFNVSRRRWLDLAEMITPQYATTHNAALLLRYTCRPLRSIIGLTDRFSSGRPCTKSQESPLLSGRVKPYNSLDVSWTLILSRKAVAYASVSNVLCRKNVFGRDENGLIRPTQDNTLYVGLILSIGG